MENNTLSSALFQRSSVRDFNRNKEVSEEASKQILLAGISAPSAGNIQPRTFIVVENQAVKQQLYELCENQEFMKDAPLWIVVCADINRHLEAAKSTGVDYDYTGILPFTFSVLDTALSLENMVIAAETLGLGSVIIGSLIEHPEQVKHILKLPNHCLALSILCIGHPKKRPKLRVKWDFDSIVCRNEYKHVKASEIREYWKRFIRSDLHRSGKKATLTTIEKWLDQGKQPNYGTAYVNHYTQEFIWNTNKKLLEFLKMQGFL